MSADVALRRKIRRMLAGSPWKLCEAGSVRELKQAAREGGLDLVLLDLDFPRAGVAAMRRITGATAILAIGDTRRSERALASGASDVVVRPLSRKLLLHRVRLALERGVALARGRNEERVKHLIDHDSLTGLPHEERLLELLSEALVAARPTREPLAILFVDLEVGRVPKLAVDPRSRDHAILALAQRMRESVRDRDSVSRLDARAPEFSLARIGGEEFCVLLRGLARPQDAFQVAARIQETLSRPITIEGRRIVVASSWGIAVSPNDGDNPAGLFEAARSACRAARVEDRGGIRFFTAEIDAAATERRRLETGLAQAVERDELIVHYQPRVELASGRISGFEALVRWQHPELGLVPPGNFIPIAEETGLIVPIGEYVLRTACAQNRAWQDAGLPSVRMSVNLSSVQFRDTELATAIGTILRETRLGPEWLELELTESVLLQKVEATIGRLHRLRDMGIRLSIDDFGTGYSSLSYLKRFPIDALKVDRSFIREVTADPGDAAITTSIVLMGKSLDLTVVAEGVETRSQLAFLRVIECHEAQGYLFSRPVPAAEAGALLASGLPAHLAA